MSAADGILAVAVAVIAYPMVAAVTAWTQRRRTAAETTEKVSGAAARAVESLSEVLNRLEVELEETARELGELRKENAALRDDVQRLTVHNDQLRSDVQRLAKRLYEWTCPSCGHTSHPE